MIVIMCDGSSKGNPGESSIGVVVWHRFGNKQRISKPTKVIRKDIGIATNLVAEFRAIIEALLYIKESNATGDVYIYSDSQVIVKIVNKIWKPKHELIAICLTAYNIILDLIKDNVNVNVTWVPRQLIQLADDAAQPKKG